MVVYASYPGQVPWKDVKEGRILRKDGFKGRKDLIISRPTPI
jgi:hypothetical protein